jgi:hypothetical protein
MDKPGKVIAIVGSPVTKLKIAARNHHDTFIIAVFFQEFLAKTEKSDGRHCIVFQDDGFCDRIKYPIQPTGHPNFAAYIGFSVVFRNFTSPVHLINNGPGCGALFYVIRMFGTGAVGNNQQF